MVVLHLMPVLLSGVLIAAHFVRNAQPLAAGLSLLALALLLVRSPWAARLVQLGLLIASIEWLRTLLNLVVVRMQVGQPWARSALILSGVAVFTVGSILVFTNERIRDRYALRAVSPQGKIE